MDVNLVRYKFAASLWVIVGPSGAILVFQDELVVYGCHIVHLLSTLAPEYSPPLVTVPVFHSKQNDYCGDIGIPFNR